MEALREWGIFDKGLQTDSAPKAGGTIALPSLLQSFALPKEIQKPLPCFSAGKHSSEDNGEVTAREKVVLFLAGIMNIIVFLNCRHSSVCIVSRFILFFAELVLKAVSKLLCVCQPC